MKKLLLFAFAAVLCCGLTACSSDDDGEPIPAELCGYWYGEVRTSQTGTIRSISLELEEDGTGEFTYISSVYYREAVFTYTYRSGNVYCEGVIAGEDGEANEFYQVFAYDGSKLRPIDDYSEFTLTKYN